MPAEVGNHLLKSSCKLHDLAFCPAAIVGMIAVRLAQESAVAAVIGFNEGDIRIREDAPSRFRLNADERIIRGMNDERGYSNSIDHVRCGRTSVVIIGSRKTAIVCRNPVIKPAQTVNPAAAPDIEVRG